MTATLRFGGREIAPSAFDEAARRTASALEEAGVGEGDVVCLMLHNRPAYLEAMLAARMLGVYYCPINWHYKAGEAGWILKDSGAKALILEPGLHAQIEAGIPAGLPVLDPAQFALRSPAPCSASSPACARCFPRRSTTARPTATP